MKTIYHFDLDGKSSNDHRYWRRPLFCGTHTVFADGKHPDQTPFLEHVNCKRCLKKLAKARGERA